MRKAILVAIILLIPTGLVAQQDLLQTIRYRTAFAYEQVTFDATVGGVGLTSATFNPVVTDSPANMTRAELAVINCQIAQMRYRVDGTGPTVSLGMIVNPGDTLTVYGFANISAFKGIRTGATSAVCDVTYYRNRQ